MDLFEQHRQQLVQKNAPLADRMRPRTLGEYIGQEHIIGEGRLLRRAIQIDQLSSLIFYGPPGTGKTTLARIIANTTKAQFLSINAVLAGVKEIRESIDTAQKTLSLYGRRTILFVDEVHRFNKSQQDALLPHVENGVLILIGATTENPYFEVNKALVSRSRIFQLKTLEENDLKAIARQAINDKERGFGNRSVCINEDALEHLVKVANGDARGVLNALELAVETTSVGDDGTILITRDIAEESIQQRAVLYDRDGDVHYDTISAFIKSVRGSDPDAALYWMAKMVYAGEDPRFIFRRLIILACEDIGMADPKALGVVMDCANAFDYVGLPEGRYHLAHACLYLATAPKSNSSMAFFDALNMISKEATDNVPDHLRDANRDKEGFGHGEGYLYPHAYRDHWVAQQYLPTDLQGKMFYQPSDQGFEKNIAERVTCMREAQIEAMVENEISDPLLSSGEKNDLNRGKWLERTLSSRGSHLGLIRDRIIQTCELQKGDLVLDLNARTGLLTFEVSRHTPDGGVWALVYDDKSYSTVQGMASKIDVLSRPQIVKTSWDTFDIDLQNHAGKTVTFEKIVGRNILLHSQNKIDLLNRIIPFLSKKGCLVLSETVPSEGQRLSQFIDKTTTDESVVGLLLRAEDELVRDPSDTLVNLDS
jgi:putative ATPase